MLFPTVPWGWMELISTSLLPASRHGLGMHKSLQRLFILVSHDARADLPRRASPRSSAELLSLTWKAPGPYCRIEVLWGDVSHPMSPCPSVLTFSDSCRTVFPTCPNQFCRTVEMLHREFTRKTSWASEANGKDDGRVKQTSPLPAPLKRIGFKSNERSKKLSKARFRQDNDVNAAVTTGRWHRCGSFSCAKPVPKPGARISSTCEKKEKPNSSPTF